MGRPQRSPRRWPGTSSAPSHASHRTGRRRRGSPLRRPRSAIAPLRSRTTTIGCTHVRSCSSVPPSATRRSGGSPPRRGGGAYCGIAEAAADVAALAALAARDGAASVRGDAWAAATLAEAASTAAARLVHVNLATRPDDELTTAPTLRPAPRPPRARSHPGDMSARPCHGAFPGDALPVAADPIWSAAVTREWAYAGSDGAVDVCIVDSGVERGHPLVGPVESAVTVTRDGDAVSVADDEPGDVCGHGTACAGIIRLLAPGCRLHSVRVLGAGHGAADRPGLGSAPCDRGAGHRVISLSLSTTKRRSAEELHELADLAYFNRTVIVASAHNLPVDSYLQASPRSCRSAAMSRPTCSSAYVNLTPPVEPFARRRRRGRVARGATLRCTGNSFAAPHIAGVAAPALGEAPRADPVPAEERPHLTATNAGAAP